MDVKLPNLGEGADSGVVVNVLVKVGDTVKPGQVLLELENEKAVAPIPAPAAGKVTKIHVKEGDRITVGHLLLSLASAGAATAAAAPTTPPPAKTPVKTAPKPAAKAPAPVAEPVEPQAPEPAPEMEAAPESSAETETEAEAPLEAPPGIPGMVAAASPSIRKMARELGIDLSLVKGSEYGGRIVMKDMRDYIQRLQKLAFAPRPAPAPVVVSAPAVAKPAPVAMDFSQWGPVVSKPMSPLRQTIGRRMTENWNTIPHVTQFDEADITDLLALRKQHVAAYEAKGARLTVTTFILKAIAATLQKHPLFNTSLDEAANALVYKHYFHIGLAVDTEAGLIVPVLRDVDKKDLVTLSREIQELAEKARERKVTADDLKGGTFTLSNQGGIGGAHFTPIVNKPEVAILGLGRAALKPVVRQGKIEPRTLAPLALSYDHRVIDGGSAARFITDLVLAIEGFKAADVAI